MNYICITNKDRHDLPLCRKHKEWITVAGSAYIMLYSFSHIVRSGHLEVVKYLIEVRGCSAGCTNCWGQTPLYHACG